MSAWRSLRRRPALAATVVVTLAVAIGATTAVWSLLEAVALRPLPYPDAERLIRIGAAVPGQSELQEVSWPKLEELRRNARELVPTSWYVSSFGLVESGAARETTGARVDRSFFEVWGVAPVLGRFFTAEEQQPGGPDAIVLSTGSWQRRYASDPAVLGSTLIVDGRVATIVGVAPASLHFPFGEVELWLPRPDDAPFLPRTILERGAGYLQVAARVSPHASFDGARRELERLSEAYGTSRPEQLDHAYRLAAVPMVEHLVGSARATLFVLLAGVVLLLVVASADVANLLLVDGLARRRELALRAALGAAPGRLARELFAECALLAAAGGALGVAFAAIALRLLVAEAGAAAELPRLDEVSLSPTALGLAFAVTSAAALFALLLPARRASRSDPASELTEEGRSEIGGRRSARTQGVLVALQVGLALVLVSSSALLVRSVRAVERLDLGFDPAGRLVAQVTLPEAAYPTAESRRALFDRLLERAREIDGVASAALVEYPPLYGAPHTRAAADGSTLAPDDQPLVQRLVVSDGAFRALGARWIAGDDFPRSAGEVGAARPTTVIVSRSLGELLFPGGDPVGRSLRLRGSESPLEIVGVVEDLRHEPIEMELEPTVYLPLDRTREELLPPSSMCLVIESGESDASSERIAAALRSAMREIDPSQPLSEIESLSSIVERATARRRLTSGILTGFSATAIALALLGVFGVVSRAVLLRRRELAVRRALGASSQRLSGELARIAAGWIAPGLVLGVLGAVAAGRALASQLFGATHAGPIHLVVTTVAVCVAVFAAGALPARRALAIDPADALRES